MKEQALILVRMDRCLGCRSCELACAVAHSQSKTLAAAIEERPLPRKRLFVEHTQTARAPVLCRHCEDAPCVHVCPTGALFSDPQTRTVQHLARKCIGCGVCAMACPFGAIEQEDAQKRGVAVKCDRCGERKVPACVEACPTRALQLQGAYEKGRRREAIERMAAAMRLGNG